MMVMQPSSAPMYTPSIFQPSYTPRYIQSDAQDHAKADVDNDSDSDNDDNGVGEEQRLNQASSSSSSQQQQQQRPREERPLSPASIASSHEEEEDNDDDAQNPSDDFMTSSAPIYIRRNVVEEDEADGVDPSFHSRTSWRGSSSMDKIQSKTSPTRPEFSRFHTDTSALVRVVRPRSHFSIPDVVVTSCEEEGQEEYFEMKVEPTRRKLSLPTTLKQLEAEREAAEERRLSEAAASSAVLPGPPAQIISATKQSRQGAKMSTSIFKTKSKPAPIRVVQERSQTVDSEKQQFPSDVSTPTTVSSASTSLPERTTFAKRMRKSSLSNLFSKKEKDAQLPPSPTIPVEWQATAGSLLEERLKQQRHQQQGDSPLQSPTAYSSMDSALPSPTSPTSPGISNEQMVKRSPTKKELKAKEKQEKALIKEREKVDKMVRKHDKMVQKALLKKASKDSTSSANKSDKESVSASSSSSSSSSLQKIAASRERMRKSAADIKAMKAADFCARHVSPPRPTMSHDEVPLPSRSRREDSTSPNNGTVSVFKGAASQVQKKAVREQTAGKRKSSGSLKASSGILTSTKKVSSEKESLESRSRRDNTPTPSQETTAMEEQDRKVAGKENDDEVNDVGDDGNQRSDDAAPFELRLDLAGRQTKESSGAPRIGDKRMSLLESLYKDIEEMEMRFEHEHASSSSNNSSNTSAGGGAASTPTPPQLPPAVQASRRSVNTGAPPREAKHPARAMSPLQREQKAAYPIHI